MQGAYSNYVQYETSKRYIEREHWRRRQRCYGGLCNDDISLFRFPDIHGMGEDILKHGGFCGMEDAVGKE